MSSVNKAVLVGNLGADPEIRRTEAGNKVASFSVATSERWRDKASGERRERTEWHRVVIFNEGLAEVAEKYLRKGSKVYVEGMLATRKWTGQDKVERYSTEIVLKAYRGELVLLDRSEGRGTPSESEYGTERTREGTNAYAQAKAGGRTASDIVRGTAAPDLDDDIPF